MLVRDQEVGGSNPLAPTILFNKISMRYPGFLAFVYSAVHEFVRELCSDEIISRDHCYDSDGSTVCIRKIRTVQLTNEIVHLAHRPRNHLYLRRKVAQGQFKVAHYRFLCTLERGGPLMI